MKVHKIPCDSEFRASKDKLKSKLAHTGGCFLEIKIVENLFSESANAPWRSKFIAFRASSYELGNRADSVAGTNYVFIWEI